LLQARGISHQGTLRVQLVFSLGGIAGGVFAGWLLDRPGMRRIVGVVGLYAAYMAAIFALAEAPPVETVIAIIGCLLGILVAAVASVLYALAPQLYPARIRGSGVGLGVTAGRVGAIIGPLFAGALLSAGLTAATVLTLMLPLVAIAGWCAVVIAIGVLPGAGRRAAD